MKVRWGLLSTANINRRLIPAIRMSPGGELVAVASRTLASAQAYAAEWHIPLAFGSYQEMLDSPNIDAVYIGLPNHLHAEWSIKALAAGKHVLCEKPFALTLAEVDAMRAAAQRHGRVLAEAFMYRHHPQTKLLGEWVHGGRLGDLLLVRATFHFPLRQPENIRFDPAMGGGALWDVGVYPVSLAQFLFSGLPTEVVGRQQLGATGIDLHFSGQMHYANGGVAQIFCSFDAPWHSAAEIIGTKGRLTINRPFVGLSDPQREMRYYPSESDSQPVDVPEQELYLGQVEDMHAAILSGQPTYLTLSESRQHVQTVLALYESAQRHELIRIPHA